MSGAYNERQQTATYKLLVISTISPMSCMRVCVRMVCLTRKAVSHSYMTNKIAVQKRSPPVTIAEDIIMDQ